MVKQDILVMLIVVSLIVALANIPSQQLVFTFTFTGNKVKVPNSGLVPNSAESPYRICPYGYYSGECRNLACKQHFPKGDPLPEVTKLLEED